MAFNISESSNKSSFNSPISFGILMLSLFFFISFDAIHIEKNFLQLKKYLRLDDPIYEAFQVFFGFFLHFEVLLILFYTFIHMLTYI